MIDWVLVSNLATALGTSLLAVATFLATRSANRSARSAERALLEGLRPILLPSNWSDPAQKVRYLEGTWVVVRGGRASVEITPEAIYAVLSLRNVGSGLAVLHGWHIPDDPRAEHADPSEFYRLTRDIYVPTTDPGFCQLAVRDRESEFSKRIRRHMATEDAFVVDVLYSDAEGSQRVISRFLVSRGPAQHADGVTDDGDEYALTVSRHWNLDLPSPRT
jgi:hypothetical protein